MKNSKAFAALLFLSVVPIQSAWADVFDDLREACIAPEELRVSICRDTQGDLTDLTCALAGDAINTAETACLNTVDSAETTAVFLQEQQFVATGQALERECLDNGVTQCMSVGITTFFSPITGRSASVCVAAAPGALLVTMSCDGLFSLPSPGASVGLQPLGTQLGTASALATFPDTKNIQMTRELPITATASATLSVP